MQGERREEAEGRKKEKDGWIFLDVPLSSSEFRQS
jgi:hypothetical protein